MILLIEDNNDIRESFAELLGLEGFDVKTADCGITGLKLAIDHLPDLIICDVLMAGMDGYEVLNALRLDKNTRDIPFIFSTSVSGNIGTQFGLQLGAKYYFVKPFDECLVIDCIKKCLSAKNDHILTGVQAQKTQPQQFAI